LDGNFTDFVDLAKPVENVISGQRDRIAVRGMVAPTIADQLILVDVMLPDGKTHRTVETKTNSTGQFHTVIGLLDDNEKILHGPYKIQAFIFHASELSDSDSNIVYITR
jgi:hypothetical protein